MRILHFATHDTAGGAAKASYRLHSALREAGHSSRMIVRVKDSDDADVEQVATRPLLSGYRRVRRRIAAYRGRLPQSKFNFDVSPEIDTRQLFSHERGAVDIICLHWITELLTTRLIRQLYEHYRCPVVWTLVDQEAVTGGCHYSLGCDGFTKMCGQCPQLNSSRERDRSRLVWTRKREHLRSLPLVFVAPTDWVSRKIRESSLFGEHRIELIPLPIDTNLFRPFEQRVARDLLQVPPDKKVIFFGATYLEEPRKGMAYLVEALQQLRSMLNDADAPLREDDIFLLIAGSNGQKILNMLPFAGRATGQLQDELSLALAYQSADVFVCPSTEDAGPMMIPEALLCGTPVVAFDAGGAPDLVETMKTGYLAHQKDSADLANGMRALLSLDCLSAIGQRAREAAALSHTPALVAERYTRLYCSLRES